MTPLDLRRVVRKGLGVFCLVGWQQWTENTPSEVRQVSFTAL